MILDGLYKRLRGKEFMDVLRGGDHKLETFTDLMNKSYMETGKR